MRRLASTARSACLLGALLLGMTLALGTGRAQDAAPARAGLVIVDEDGTVGYAVVSLDRPEISGMDLLRRSGAEPVTVAFGGLGEGVCGIGKTGCAIDVCRRRMCQTGAEDSPYWQSFAPDGAGGWSALALGATADRVRVGDVRLWAWTANEPALAPILLADIVAKTDGAVDTVVWVGGAPSGDGPGGSLWVGVGLLAAAGAVAASVVVRSRARSR